MNRLAIAALTSLALIGAAPLAAQEGGDGEIIVTSYRRTPDGPVVRPPPVVGLRRQADSAVRPIAIVSDSRELELRQREVRAMLLAAIDQAKRDGFSLVTGQYTLVEVTRENWQRQFPKLAAKASDDEDEEDEEDFDEDDEDEDDEDRTPAFEDDGRTATLNLKLKTRLDGSIESAGKKLSRFIKSVPVTGRSQINQTGRLQLTIINPEQYRDEIYRRIATAATHAVSFYGADYSLDLTDIDKAIAWKQVSDTELFLYIPYQFSVKK